MNACKVQAPANGGETLAIMLDCQKAIYLDMHYIYNININTVCVYIHIYIYIYMGTGQKLGMDRSAVICAMDPECLRKVPDPYPFVRVHHSIQTVLILLLAITSPPATVAAKTVTTASRVGN